MIRVKERSQVFVTLGHRDLYIRLAPNSRANYDGIKDITQCQSYFTVPKLPLIQDYMSASPLLF